MREGAAYVTRYQIRPLQVGVYARGGRAQPHEILALSKIMLVMLTPYCMVSPPPPSLLQPPPTAPPQLTGAWRRTILVGTHHKTGTVLLSKVFRVAAKMVGVTRARSNHSSTLSGACSDLLERRAPGVCIVEHISARDVGRWLASTHVGDGEANHAHPHHHAQTPFAVTTLSAMPQPFLHAVRDPLEMCVSAYQYHLLGAEPWLLQPMRDLNGSTLQQYYNALGPREGVRFECKRMIIELVETALVYNATRGLQSALTVRLEDFAKDYDTTSRRLFAFLGSGAELTDALVNASARFDLSRGSAPEDARHVSTSASKQPLRDMVLTDPQLGRVMAQLRELLGYRHLNDHKGGASGGAGPTAISGAGSRATPEELCDQLQAICATTRVGFMQWCSYGRIYRGRVPSLPTCGEPARVANKS